jgi:putative membrane protein
MIKTLAFAAALSFAAITAHAEALNDAQIAHIAYTADNVDIAAGKQALAKSHDKAVRDFAQEMVRDHTAVNDKALALVKKLHVTPEDNATSQSLAKNGAEKLKELGALSGKAFDKAYAENEVAYHKTVDDALSTTLIPNAKNPQLKALLETGLTLFKEHLAHAERLAASLK